jgi:hypothetical protein
MLTLRVHGGHCCGVAHLHGFPSSLNNIQQALSTSPNTFKPMSGHTNCYNTSAPPEEAQDRVDRWLALRDRGTTYNITEAYLSTGQIGIWGPFLVSRGFEKVAQCYNSNSGNQIACYLRVKDYTHESQKKFAAIRAVVLKRKTELAEKEAAKKALAAKEVAEAVAKEVWQSKARSEAAKKGWQTRLANARRKAQLNARLKVRRGWL